MERQSGGILSPISVALLFVMALVLCVLLSGCGPSQPSVPLDPNAPVTQGQLASQQQSPAANGALWGLGGFLLGRMSASRPAAQYAAPAGGYPMQPQVVHQTVVKKTIINNHPAPAPVVTPPKVVQAPRPTTTPSYRPSPPRTSYSAPRSSFSGSRGGRR